MNKTNYTQLFFSCMPLFIIANIFLMPITIISQITFSADYVILNAGNELITSGNSQFHHKAASIKSNIFRYNLNTFDATFADNVHIQYTTPTTNIFCDKLSINTVKKTLIGSSNVIISNNDITIVSDQFFSNDYSNKIVTLVNNVHVKQQNNTIHSDQLIFDAKTHSILSNKRVRLHIE